MPKLNQIIESSEGDLGHLIQQYQTVENYLIEDHDQEDTAVTNELEKQIFVHVGPQIYSGLDLFNRMQSTQQYISSGCNSMDEILQGGWRFGQVTELSGASSSGKSQLCVQAALMFSRNQLKVLYIDAQGSFSAYRIQQMAQQRYVANLNDVLSQILVSYATHINLVFGVLESQIICSQNNSNFNCVVIDSLPAILTPVIGDRQQRGYTLVALLGQVLRGIAIDYGICVIVCNHGIGDGGTGRSALGEDWAGQVHNRIGLEYNKQDGNRYACIYTSTYLVSGVRTNFQIGDAGVF